MFAHTYFPAGHYAPTYFNPAVGAEPPTPPAGPDRFGRFNIRNPQHPYWRRRIEEEDVAVLPAELADEFTPEERETYSAADFIRALDAAGQLFASGDNPDIVELYRAARSGMDDLVGRMRARGERMRELERLEQAQAEEAKVALLQAYLMIESAE